MRIDHFSSTLRGLFLAPGRLERTAREIVLRAEPVGQNAAAAVEVVSAPSGCPIDVLEVIEPLPGAVDAWQTRDVPVEEGMRLAVPIGGRYANLSLSGDPPARPVPPGTVLDLLNKGGVTGHCTVKDVPTVKLRVAGGIEIGGKTALVSDLATIRYTRIPIDESGTPRTPIVLVTGSDMEVGKTTCAATLALSLRTAGIRVAYAKLTGTGRMRDLMRVSYGRPAGFFDSARTGWDFVDAGLASTFGAPIEEVRRRSRNLLRHAAGASELVLAEIADAPCADGSVAVATDPWLHQWVHERGLLIFACDNLSSTLILQWIRSHMDIDEENILISGPVANDRPNRIEAERMAHIATVSCTSPSGLSPLGGKAAGGALADWVIRHIMARRRTAV